MSGIVSETSCAAEMGAAQFGDPVPVGVGKISVDGMRLTDENGKHRGGEQRLRTAGGACRKKKLEGQRPFSVVYAAR